MIARLTGEVVERRLQGVVLDVGGVGYLVLCSEAAAAAMPLGKKLTLRIHTAVRDDAIDLFGFASALEETLFHELIRVPGIGPRVAMNILSGGRPEEIIAAIVGQDFGRLRKLPGVGKKTAERLVVDLRERLAPLAPAQGAQPAPPAVEARPQDDDVLLQALLALGYKQAEAERLATLARSRAAAEAPLEELVREALRVR